MTEQADLESEIEDGADPKDAAIDYGADAAEEEQSGVGRDTELSEIEEYEEALTKVRQAVWQGFQDQERRAKMQLDFWDVYECRLNDNQAYNGNNQLFVPLVRDCVDARVTRYTNQIFPQNGRYVEVIDMNGDVPHAETALLEHYVDKAKLRTEVVPACFRNGDVEGQYNLYVDWNWDERHVITKDQEVSQGDEDVITMSSEIVPDEHPIVEVLPDADVIILPATADSIRGALRQGGCVAILRRWSKDKIEHMAEKGVIREDMAETIMGAMDAGSGGDQSGKGTKDIKKEHASAAGIKAKGKYYMAYEVWHTLKIDEDRRIVRSFFGSDDHQFLGTKLNPIWWDLIPVISHPVKKISGSAKGGSQIAPVAGLQYFANDMLNQAADSANYSMLPIVMTDPESNPKSSTMIMDLAAVWEVSPDKTKFVTFPSIWEKGFEIINAIKGQIQQSLAVTAAMIPQSGRKKPTQAEIANEQAIDLLTTAEAVSNFEQGVLNPMLELFVALDMQYRVDDLMVSMYGLMGRRAKMERVQPLQAGNKIEFKWMGVQAARNAQMIQQQIGFVNVLRGVPKEMYQGYRLNIIPILENATESVFGPRLAPEIFQSEWDQLSVPPEEENDLMLQNMDLPVSPMDDDAKHMQVHQQALAMDVDGFVKAHIQKHQVQIQMKQQAKMAQMVQQMMGGQMGGPQHAARRGRQGGQPRAGAKPGQPRAVQGPAGNIHQDQMTGAGASPMPRPRG